MTQFNTHCAHCAAPVTRVFTVTDAVVLIDPNPADDGYIYFTGAGPHGKVVTVAGSPEEVPSSEPLRYKHHVCAR